MTDTSDSFAPRSSRTTPEAIAERSFSQVKRGYAESEVRAYLRMVSSDFASAASRERELTARVRELEDQLRQPVLPPSDQDLITALGEETARVLGQARQSAIELKNKAEEHARRVVREAQETARELRTTTQQAVEAKTREAEDAARNRAKEIVGEARGLRERVLADLEARRQELERQIADLRAGRGKLVETYELVERALGHAARVMAEEPSTPPDVPAADVPAADVPAAEVPAPDDAPTAAVPTPAPEPRTDTCARTRIRARRAESDAATDDPDRRSRGRVGARCRRAVREAAFRAGRHPGDEPRRPASNRRPRSSRSKRWSSKRWKWRKSTTPTATSRSTATPPRWPATPPWPRPPTTSSAGASVPSRTSRTTSSTASAVSGARSTCPRSCRRWTTR